MPQNLHVGGIKMRERGQGQSYIKVSQNSRTNEAKYSDNEEKSNKISSKRKAPRKIIKAGSLVRKTNAQPNIDNDFSNSFIEGKSFVNGNNTSNKPYVANKPLNRDIVQVNNGNESETSCSQRNIRDLERNSKLLDLQNKLLSTASIGPYPIGANTDPNSTIKSLGQETDQIDKKLKQKQYVMELEQQIRLRDKIKEEEEQKVIQKRGTIDKIREDEFNVTPQWSNMDYNKSFKSVADPESSIGGTVDHFGLNKNSNLANLSPSKSSGLALERKGLGSAPKAAATVIMSNPDGPDPFGGNIPIRKKVVNRIDQELESRGSIFSGRDERSILVRKRNLQQQHMREELLRQIEEKKQREADQKQRKMAEEVEEEKRIAVELKRLNSNEETTDNSSDYVARRQSDKQQRENQAISEELYPKLTNRQSEPIKDLVPVEHTYPETIYNSAVKSPSKLETTAAFAHQPEPINIFKEEPEENIAKSNQHSFKNAMTIESNKIKEMINQVDNKKSLQDQINRRMDLKSNQNAKRDGSPITSTNGPVVGNPEISELSDIVKKLLEEQRELKSKLNERDNIIADLSKNKDQKTRSTQERERRTKSMKPPNNGKKVGSADNKSLAARKLREKHLKDKERLDAIEDKIEKARKRRADISNQTTAKSTKSKNSDYPGLKNRPSSDFDPKAKKSQYNMNQDIDGVTDRNIKNNLDDLNVCKARGIESPGYTISSKIDELNTQSRSKQSNYDYAIENKASVSRKLADKYSNIRVPYDDLELDEDDIQEDQAFIFSLPPDDDDNYSSYSLLGGQVIQRTPMTEFDAAASEGGDQIDLLMNAYSRSNVRPMDRSEFTTSLGMNYSPNFNDFSNPVSRDDNMSGFYQSGNFPAPPINNKNTNQKYDQFYASSGNSKFGVIGNPYPVNNQYHVTSSESQYRARQLNANAFAGGQMMSNNGKLIMSPGTCHHSIYFFKITIADSQTKSSLL